MFSLGVCSMSTVSNLVFLQIYHAFKRVFYCTSGRGTCYIIFIFISEFFLLTCISFFFQFHCGKIFDKFETSFSFHFNHVRVYYIFSDRFNNYFRWYFSATNSCQIGWSCANSCQLIFGRNVLFLFFWQLFIFSDFNNYFRWY